VPFPLSVIESPKAISFLADAVEAARRKNSRHPRDLPIYATGQCVAQKAGAGWSCNRGFSFSHAPELSQLYPVERNQPSKYLQIASIRLPKTKKHQEALPAEYALLYNKMLYSDTELGLYNECLAHWSTLGLNKQFCKEVLRNWASRQGTAGAFRRDMQLKEDRVFQGRV
jgi:hypothetical protein